MPNLCYWHGAGVNQLHWLMCLHDPLIDDRISKSIMRNGCWECTSADEMVALLNRNGTLIDIGANIGFFSLAAAASGATVYAFEASPRNSVLFQESVLRNGFQSITLHAVALGAAPGMVRVGASPTNQGGLHHVEASGGTQVARVTLDSVLAPAANRPVFIKMDVEGAECGVVRGMSTFLRESQIVGVLIEVKSRDCCDELCGGLFRDLHARSLCPWARGSHRNPKREALRHSNCQRWCGAQATGDVFWRQCAPLRRGGE